MNAPLDVKNKHVARWYSLVGFVGLYPVLAAFTRSCLHIQVPLDNLDYLGPLSSLLSPPLLLLCAGKLLLTGPGWFRAVGAFYFLTLAWWVWILVTYDF